MCTNPDLQGDFTRRSGALGAANETSIRQPQTDREQAYVTTTEAHTVDLDGIVTVTAR